MNTRSALILPKLVVLFYLAFFLFSEEGKSQVIINEVLASNSRGISDEDGDYPDWIELYNPTGNTINLEGYGISDDPDDLFKYILPSLEIPANQYYLLFASDKNRGSNSDYEPKFWETVVRQGDAAKYIIPAADISSSWMETGFDDSTWLDGFFGFGYGDNDDATIVPNGTIAVFTRTTFTIEDASQINDLLLHIDFDDGYIAYLNGVEISRFNMAGESPLPYNTLTTDFITDPRLVTGQALTAIELEAAKDLLVDGENVLAIQVHNTNAQSSDMSLIPFLSIARNKQPTQSRGVAEQISIASSGLSYPHLNFKLSSKGETLFLTNPDTVLTDSLRYPFLKPDESFGKSALDDSTYYIFTLPTPLAENNTQGFESRSGDPVLNFSTGIYDNNLQLSVVGEVSGDMVYFTTDGSDPTEQSELFGTEEREVSSTSVYKFRSIESGKLYSNIVTHTYFIGEEHDLPVFSISTEPDNLWSDESGIYVRGTNGIDANGSNGPANWNQDWEIPVFIEYFELGDTFQFGSGAGAKIFGGWSRSINPQKSLSIFFRGEYGNSELEYKLFDSKDIDTFQAFVLRNSGNDYNNTHLRDGLMTTLMQDSEVEYQAFKPAVVYLNGEYWGIHNIREKVNEHFIESNSNADSENIDLLENDRGVIHGSAENYNNFLSALGSSDLSNEEEYSAIEQMIDIDNYIDYTVAQIYYANTDWPGNNIKYWRSRESNGKWRWILFDTDFGFGFIGGVSHNTLEFALNPNGPSWPNPSWSTYVFRRMVSSPVFVRKFVNRMADFMNTSFHPDYVNHVIDSLAENIEDEMPRHMSRWGGSVNNWNNQLNVLKDFANNRGSYIKSHFMSRFDLQLPSRITVNTSNKDHGSVMVNRITPDSYPWEGRYFRGVPVEITAIPKRGYRFVGWDDDSEVISHKREVLAGTAIYTANFEPFEGEARDIVINEIMYNDSDEFPSGDWIELHNTTEYDIDLSGWIIKDEDETHEYIFTNGTKISAGSYVVVASDLESFNTSYDIKADLYGDLGFNLSGSSDQVRLYDYSGILVDSLDYQDEAPWDESADGTGFTLELINSTEDNALAANWVASSIPGGTPGAANSILVSNEEQENLPSELSLSQNYPNPFNPSTNITFQLPEQSRIKLSVFDILGRKVSTLADGVRSAGTHTVTWNARQFSSGVYFYRLEVGDEVTSRRMLLIK